MSQLYGQQPKHRCQIDCSNHDEVIGSLQLKSKDLYLFWRNYDWLYTQYYALLNQPPAPEPPKESYQNCLRQIQALEAQNDNLLRENKSLKLDFQAYKKRLNDQSSALEADYRRELTIWQNKAHQYQTINQKLLEENGRLRNGAKSNDGAHEAEISRMALEHKRSLQTIVQLQQVIDQLRHRSAVQPVKVHEGPTAAQLEQLSRRQVTVVSERMRRLQAEVQRMVAMQFEGLKGEIDGRLMEMLTQLSQQELQSVVVTVEDRY